MAIEIERKFLLKNDTWQNDSRLGEGQAIKQGYLNTDKSRTVRVRTKGEKAYLTIKGKTEGISRAEFEYEIPVEDALELLKLCEASLEKTRYLLPINNIVWEIDVFEGKHKGLLIAEVELTSEEQAFELPNWIGKEVSGDKCYFNSYLAVHTTV